MAIKRPKPEEIVVKLRQVEVLIGQGMLLGYRPPAPEAIIPMDQQPIMH